MMGFGVTFWIVLIVALLLFVRGIFPDGTDGKGRDGGRQVDSREIINQRYAKGEMNRDY